MKKIKKNKPAASLKKSEVLSEEELREKLQSCRDDLNLSLVSVDPEEMDITTLGKILQALTSVKELCEKNGLDLFSRAFSFIHQFVSSITMGEMEYNSGMLKMLEEHKLLEEELEYFFFNGTVSESFGAYLEALEAGISEKGPEVKQGREERPEEVVQNMADVTDPTILPMFLTDSLELIEIAETELMSLENDPENSDLINSLFRGLHTIKGSAGFLGLSVLSALAHDAETLLDQLRKGETGITTELINCMLTVIDAVRQLLVQLKDLFASDMDSSKVSPVNIGEAHRLLDYFNSGEAKSKGPPPARKKAPDMAKKPAETTASSAGKSISMEVVKVPSEKLDDLSELVGELVVAVSVLSHNETIAAIEDREVKDKFNQMEKITESLRDKTLEVRMIPVDGVFARLSRQVRDLSLQLDKKVQLTTQGNDTLVDKLVVDEIYSPLMHIVRNAIDHGLEEEEERARAGKTVEGNVTLSAFHRGDSIWVEVSDDGKGLDKEKILSKAIENGIIQDQSGMTDEQIFDLIFHAGFSTAEKVTDVSGRGVGMDVVKTMLEKLRGKIIVTSEKGKGSTFSLRLPMTTSIIEGLIVRIGKSQFVAPLLSVRQTVTPSKDQLKSVHDREGECFLYQDQVIPILRLYEFYRIEPDYTDPSEALILVVENGTRSFGLMVDELLHRQQVVIKNIRDRFDDLRGISGGTILGNGQVGLILDPEEIVNQMRK